MGSPSQHVPPVPAPPWVPSLRAKPKFSLRGAKASNDLLASIEEGHVEDVRRLVFQLPEGITPALNTPSLLVRHKLRTPLMAAAASGDFAKLTTILNAFNRQYDNKLARDFEMRLQLANRDRGGMTAAMLGARSRSVPIVAALVAEIEETKALVSLETRDHRHMTLILHAASVGPAPIFHEVQEAVTSSIQDDEAFERQLLLKSADDKTILMHAASSGDAMLLKVVADACRTAIPPQKVRRMLVERDCDGLNFLMHAASCDVVATSPASGEDDDEDAEDTQQETGDDEEERESGVKLKREGEMSPGDMKNDTNGNIVQDAGTVTVTTAIAPAGTVPPGSSPPLPDGLLAQVGTSEVAARASISTKGGPKADAMERPPVVPVFKMAFKILTDCLWTHKVPEQLKATDLWGRNVLTHALLSGHKLMFEAALGAVRDVVSDEEVSGMLETNEGEREDEPMINALDQGELSMRKLFALRVGQLKNDVDARSKLSSIDAKIESFIPGKLVVIFQLLLPQIAVGNQLLLLYMLCAFAPILKLATWTASTTGGSSKRTAVTARTGKLSIFLGAPAMFFWGVGTSDVGTTSALGWSPALSATTMAVATIVIPALDGFFYSSNASLLGDKIFCTEWRFNFKEYRRWLCGREEWTANVYNAARQRGYETLPAYSNHGDASTTYVGGVEEGKR